MNEQTKKQRWIVKERERLLKEHRDYREIIEQNEIVIKKNLQSNADADVGVIERA